MTSDQPVNSNPFTTPLGNGLQDPASQEEPENVLARPLDGGQFDDEAEFMRSQNFRHEMAIRRLGFFWIVTPIFFPLLAIWSLRLLRGSSVVDEFSWLVVALIVVLILPGIAVGIGLMRLNNAARLMAGIIAIPTLLIVPIGTLLAICVLILCFSSKGVLVCSPAYHEAIRSTPHIRSGGLVVPVVAAIMILLLFALVYIIAQSM